MRFGVRNDDNIGQMPLHASACVTKCVSECESFLQLTSELTSRALKMFRNTFGQFEAKVHRTMYCGGCQFSKCRVMSGIPLSSFFHFITYSLGCGASCDSSDILA